MIETDVQEIAFSGPGFTLCRFHCPHSHRRWSRDNAILDGHHVVFPRTFVTIAQAGRPPILADSNRAVFYNDGTVFRRHRTSHFDDRSDIFLIDSDTVAEVIQRYDASVIDRPNAPFDRCAGAVDSSTLRRERLLFAHLGGPTPPVEELVHETVLGIVESVVRSNWQPKKRPSTPSVTTRRRNRDRVDAALSFVANHYLTHITLSDVARFAGCSVYHLCRVFQKTMGTPLYRYLYQLRLRAALDLILDGSEPLAQIAQIVGFAHQSHFTEAFRLEFGDTPAKTRSFETLASRLQNAPSTPHPR